MKPRIEDIKFTTVTVSGKVYIEIRRLAKKDGSGRVLESASETLFRILSKVVE